MAPDRAGPGLSPEFGPISRVAGPFRPVGWCHAGCGSLLGPWWVGVLTCARQDAPSCTADPAVRHAFRAPHGVARHALCHPSSL